MREILKILPHEDIIYFGDTGRVPYGNKSYETIKKYGRQSVNFLLSKNVKIILAACGTVSSVAIEDLRGEFSDVPILGIIESACEKSVKSAESTGRKKIGVIGTQATVSRGAFSRYIRGLDGSCEVYERACPLFVHLVENGHTHDGDMITKLAAEKYLSEMRELNLSSLILGCTHYPMIKNIIGEVIKTDLIDAGVEAAHKLKREMTENDMLNVGKAENIKNIKDIDIKERIGNLEIFINDEGINFSEIASAFLGFDIKSRIYKIDIENY